MNARARLTRAALLTLLGGLVVLFWLDHLRLALDKQYAIDEFQYAHGAWRIAQGDVIYRDFFEHHFPLVHQLMAAVFLAAGDEDPNVIVYLRLAMLPFLTLLVAAAALVNRAYGWSGAVLTALVVLAVPTLSMMAVEIRPDPLAFALFLAALAVLYLPRPGRRWRGFLSGLLAVAALWGTLKAAYYGLIFPAALAADFLRRREDRDEDGFLLGHPVAFLAGGAAAALPIAVYLTWTGSWSAWFEWSIRWSFVHQLHYPGFFWTRNLTPLLAQSFWLFPLAAVGMAATWRSRPAPGSPDWLLLASAATTLASFAWQSAAYLYSLIPFTAVLCVFAARGLAASLRFMWNVRGAGTFAAVLLVLIAGVELRRARANLVQLRAVDNAAQHALLGRVGALTRPGEPVLNIAGGQVTRPSVHFFYFFEAVVRQLRHDVFAYELPRSLVEKGCIAYMPSERFGRLPAPLRRFLLENYLPYDRELWFWGRRYAVDGGELAARFVAPRDGRYFVWPPEPPRRGELRIGERPVASPVFDLAAGDYGVTYRGELRELFLVWLPADGRPFVPRPELQAAVQQTLPDESSQ